MVESVRRDDRRAVEHALRTVAERQDAAADRFNSLAASVDRDLAAAGRRVDALAAEASGPALLASVREATSATVAEATGALSREVSALAATAAQLEARLASLPDAAAIAGLVKRGLAEAGEADGGGPPALQLATLAAQVQALRAAAASNTLGRTEALAVVQRRLDELLGDGGGGGGGWQDADEGSVGSMLSSGGGSVSLPRLGPQPSGASVAERLRRLHERHGGPRGASFERHAPGQAAHAAQAAERYVGEGNAMYMTRAMNGGYAGAGAAPRVNGGTTWRPVHRKRAAERLRPRTPPQHVLDGGGSNQHSILNPSFDPHGTAAGAAGPGLLSVANRMPAGPPQPLPAGDVPIAPPWSASSSSNLSSASSSAGAGSASGFAAGGLVEVHWSDTVGRSSTAAGKLVLPSAKRGGNPASAGLRLNVSRGASLGD